MFMKEIKINKYNYKLIKEEKDAFDLEEVTAKTTDYFNIYDYIVGDWSYGKLRLKGFTKKNNKNYKKLNDFDNLDNYLEEYCAFGCRYFILEKIND